MQRPELNTKEETREDVAVVEAVRRGDKSAFTALAERYRRELGAYCYRMLVEAHERRDLDGLLALLHDDLRWSMPPEPGTYVGRERVVGHWVSGGFGTLEFGEFRCVLTRANRVPAVALYLKKPGQAPYVPMAMDVLRIEGDTIREITSFYLSSVREAFGLPKELT